MTPDGVPPLGDLVDRRFRSNADFVLVAPERLPASSRPRRHGGEGDRVLVPRAASGITAKLLDRKASQLVEALSTAGPLPDDARGADGERAVARLVLDGGLEIESEDGFVSGAAAHRVLFHGRARRAAGGPLAQLSLRALRYGAAVATTDAAGLSRRLYGYGTVPRSIRWEQVGGAEDDVSGALGLAPGGPARVLLADYEALANPSWMAWVRSGADRSPELPFKLYVGVRPEALLRSFPRIVSVLAAAEVHSFKVGRGVAGLLRPDKLVVYLESRDQLDLLAAELETTLRGSAVHGVPFTAATSGDGLLSWGMDPPAAEWLVSARSRESWRSWLTNRLAGNLIAARLAPGEVEPWRFALDRLSLDGVDPLSWLPQDELWR